MKKILIVLVLFSFLITLPVFGEEVNYLQGAAQKAKHGVINTLLGWLELPFQVIKGYKHGFGEEGKNKLVGGFLGIFRGIGHSIGRTASGVMQLATCLLPNHKDNNGIGIPLDSQYAWEEGQQYSILKEGLAPIGKKFARGTVDSLGSPLEVPAQLNKAFNQTRFTSVLLGICKAITYPIARIASGTYDVVTALLPSDAGTYGRPFDEKYPWSSLGEYPVEGQEEMVADVYEYNMYSP
ncbi:MAG: hypothetical protein PHN57_03865 [Candidatus Omnitrophica bacterium]|nr:hypothetical protein [Candidatus Omnitrophota bacterium]